jgi:Nrap protein domain 6
MKDYDFFIRVQKEEAGTGSVYKNLREETWKDVLVDFDPVRDFIRDLEVCQSRRCSYRSRVLGTRFYGFMTVSMDRRLLDSGILNWLSRDRGRLP